MPMTHRAWQQDILKHNLNQGPQTQTISNTVKIKLAVDQAVVDTGINRTRGMAPLVEPIFG